MKRWVTLLADNLALSAFHQLFHLRSGKKGRIGFSLKAVASCITLYSCPRFRQVSATRALLGDHVVRYRQNLELPTYDTWMISCLLACDTRYSIPKTQVQIFPIPRPTFTVLVISHNLYIVQRPDREPHEDGRAEWPIVGNFQHLVSNFFVVSVETRGISSCFHEVGIRYVDLRTFWMLVKYMR